MSLRLDRLPIKAALWVALAAFALALPFIVLLAGERASGRSVLWDFSMGLGFGALAAAGLQFVLTARFQPITRPYGIDIVYLFHRYFAIGAVALMLGHFGILYIWFQPELGDLNPLTARWELTMGRVALASFVLLVITSELRKTLHLPYGLWRYGHVILAVIAFGSAVTHILGVGHFTGEADKRILWLGVAVSWAGLLVWTRLVRPFRLWRNPWRIVENIPREGGVHSLVLEPKGEGLKNWKPGQFVWLTLGASPFALKEHPFTISTPPEHGPQVTLSIKPLGDFSAWAARTRPGAKAYLDGPFGAFSVDNDPDAEGFVMIAGGVGITPMISNIHALDARGDQRRVILIYATKDMDTAHFRDELEELEKRLNLHLVHVPENPPAGWEGESGFIDRELLERHLPEETHQWPHFLCGPGPLTDAAKSHLRAMGVPLAAIDAEIFDLV
ncbi:MAG: ferredoxin reductase family protein [Caulobacterales bacterium]|uniref:ferredoxin reductase family protein n=1 Tax=Glycocaulis sp. TaxID=1969725 RepID=UPI003FA1612C